MASHPPIKTQTASGRPRRCVNYDDWPEVRRQPSKSAIIHEGPDHSPRNSARGLLRHLCLLLLCRLPATSWHRWQGYLLLTRLTADSTASEVRTDTRMNAIAAKPSSVAVEKPEAEDTMSRSLAP